MNHPVSSLLQWHRLALALALVCGGAYAADKPPAHDMAGMMHEGKMGRHCPMHHPEGMGQMIRIPRLPPGNEKIQLEMDAEILQKVGEIQAKFAARLP